jgi:hypothetical protein
MQVIVADAETAQPVSHVSLYTKENGRFHSCISDMQGRASVAFHFSRLTVSHLNYERRTLRHLPDTIFLRPKYEAKAEVVISSKEPEWIRRCLKQTVKLKDKHYFTHEGYERYAYYTQSIGTNNIYRMHATGLLRMRDARHKYYAIAPDTCCVTAPDSTRLTDTYNLRRMLYEDFMADLDNGFISAHRFYESPKPEGLGRDEVELRFRSKRSTDDRGWLVLDTAACVITSASRTTGTKTNRRERIDAVMYSLARIFGYSVDTWTRDYRVAYARRTDGTLYPAEVRYKMYYAGKDGDYDERQEEFHSQTGDGFPNMEATLKLSPCHEKASDSTLWLELPTSWYIRFNSDADRQREIELSNLPSSFTIYEDEP